MNTEDALNRAPEPLEPSEDLFASIMQHIDEEDARVVPGGIAPGEPTPTELTPTGPTSTGPTPNGPTFTESTPQPDFKARPRRGLILLAAATVAILAGSMVVLPQLTSQPEQNTVAEQPTSPSNTPTGPPTGVDQMHDIMAAKDLRTADINGHGMSIAIVASDTMGKAGAMVQGTPSVDDGMGAQVWAIMSDGTAKSAGVIDRNPHSDVWMPLPAGTMRVTITEEPGTGSQSPSGQMLSSEDVS
ncbi:anti-sigma factor [Corynebacterium auriscanis]|uniref:anti-sigma factor n=1 Tax=Corynebacterium auriscanis TaxID=99807 RepID=UPI0024ACA5F4|nr:anti-sigma factor [Corynebacterium auriscanis]